MQPETYELLIIIAVMCGAASIVLLLAEAIYRLYRKVRPLPMATYRPLSMREQGDEACRRG